MEVNKSIILTRDHLIVSV